MIYTKIQDHSYS